MVVTVIFVFYAALFGFLYQYTQNWSLRKRLAEPLSPKPTSFLANVLIPAGIPWFLLLLAGTYWGFTNAPENVRKLRLSQSDDMSVLLLIAILIAIALSYSVIFQAGSFAGYREGRYNAIGHFPHFVREGPDGKPFEIRGYVDRRNDLSIGVRLLHEGRFFGVTNIEDLGECSYVTAQYKCQSEV